MSADTPCTCPLCGQPAIIDELGRFGFHRHDNPRRAAELGHPGDDTYAACKATGHTPQRVARMVMDAHPGGV